MEDTLPNRIKYWLTEAKHDCFFVVGPEGGPTERIGAMKTLLMGNSEPFRAMLQDSGLAEKGDIRVTDVEKDTFRNFLKCVYGASNLLIPKFTFEECAKLLYVAEKYLVNDLKTELSKHMTTILSVDNIQAALSYPHCYQEITLKRKIMEILKFDFKAIATSDKILGLSDTSIAWILQQNCFTVREVEIWHTVLRWAKSQTNSEDGKVLRMYMLEFLKFIRFLTMDFNEFWEEVVSSEVLLEEEVNDICRSFVSGKPCSLQNLCNVRYNRYDTVFKSENVITSFMGIPQYALIHCSVSSVGDLKLLTYYSKTYLWKEYFWHLEVAKKKKKKRSL